VALGVPAWKLPFLIVEATRLLRASMHVIGFNPGMKELLEELQRRGLKVAIVSTNAEENIRTFLQHHGAEALVDRVVCSSRLFGKAALLKKVMKEERLQPEALIYVGDETRDIEACREVDVSVIGVTWGFDSEELLVAAKPDLLAKEPAEIVRWVLANEAAGHVSVHRRS
jgi:phosphoglycolate phosphatase